MSRRLPGPVLLPMAYGSSGTSLSSQALWRVTRVYRAPHHRSDMIQIAQALTGRPGHDLFTSSVQGFAQAPRHPQ
ncbi:hypothetical protein ASD08_15925 [Streptomyces sp. Root369]|nr:hypothetical protein ASD08_15925 [Streptomyces sp. Root369]